MTINESLIEEATLQWVEKLGYAALHGSMLAPSEPTAERVRLVMWCLSDVCVMLSDV